MFLCDESPVHESAARAWTAPSPRLQMMDDPAVSINKLLSHFSIRRAKAIKRGEISAGQADRHAPRPIKCALLRLLLVGGRLPPLHPG